ncbi:MAG: ATP-dependent DNA helicase, partial [Myxococcales bacterium]|nr:ATP-dependent DNA helicase [Myxococcales bacterium]
FYLTAKTTGREGVARAFRDIVAKSDPVAGPPLRATTLRRKESMCPPGHLVCHPKACDHLADFDVRADRLRALPRLLDGDPHVDPEVVYRLGARERLCPYELMLRLSREADLVVGDFNHAFDPAASALLGRFGGEPVVVVDEAHNLFDRARAVASCFVATSLCHEAERRAADEPQAPLRHAVTSLARRVAAAIAEERRVAAGNGEEERVPVDGCLEHKPDPDRWRGLVLEAEGLGLRWAAARYRSGDVAPRDPVLALAEAVSALWRRQRRPHRAFVGYVASSEGPQGAGVGFLCVDPSEALERQHRRFHGLVVMSATLSPTPYYVDVLGLSRLDPMVTSAPSPFPEEHREVIVVPSVDTTYARREDQLPAIAAMIERIVAVRPGNYMVFVSSHRALAELAEIFAPAGHRVLRQPPMASGKLRDRILATLRAGGAGGGGGPTVLLAVTGGVFGEGVDLPGEAVIGSIVVGPALPPPTFERLVMQRHFEEQREAGFAYAMAYPALQKVIQSAGRVIRREDDRGIIALLGRRFAEEPFVSGLPSAWHRHGPRDLLCDDPVPRLERFWER